MATRSKAWTVALVALQVFLVLVWVSTQDYSASSTSLTSTSADYNISVRGSRVGAASVGSNVTSARNGSYQNSANVSNSTNASRKSRNDDALQVYFVPKREVRPEAGSVGLTEKQSEMRQGKVSSKPQPVHHNGIPLIDKLDGLVPEVSKKIFVSVKTAYSIQTERLPPLLSTWLQMFDGNQVHIVTDRKGDPVTLAAEDLGMTVIESNCSAGHGLDALCCKSGIEFEQYYQAVGRGEDYDWFCHFDDDVYVNVPNLVKTLKQYDHNENIYLGHYHKKWGAKGVTKEYMENYWSQAKMKKKHTFYYALGPAYCISKELMRKLPPFFRGANTFKTTCKQTGLPDDATVGIIIEHYLGFSYFEVGEMLNELAMIRKSGIIAAGDCRNLVTIGYVRKSYYYALKHHHLKYSLEIPLRSESSDPTGFLSLHCFLYPRTHWCS